MGGTGAGCAPDCGGQSGQGIGSGLFLQGNGSFTRRPRRRPDTDHQRRYCRPDRRGRHRRQWRELDFIKNGAGTTILTGQNAYSGGTVVNAGVLQGNTSGLQGNIVNNASVVFNQANSGTYAGNMSGTGALSKTGVGVVTLAGTNSHSGGTIVSGGTLLFTSDANLGAAGSGITLNNGITATWPRSPSDAR